MSTSHLQRNTLVGLVASLALAGSKLAAGLFGHSSALVADAVESMADSIGSIIVWQGLRISDKPPDQEHPYGYGKAEAVAAFCVGALLLIAAAVIILKAFRDLLTPHTAPAPWTLLVFAVAIALKEGLFRIVIRGANAFESDAARADAWHHRSDAITSAAAFIGVAIAIWGPSLFNSPRLVLADEIAAIIASGMILLTGLSLMRPSLRELLDASAPELIDKVRTTASAIEGVRLVEKVHARKSGRGYQIDMHLHVDPHLSVHAAHALSGKVKAHLRTVHPNIQGVLIHIEPDETSPATAPTGL